MIVQLERLTEVDSVRLEVHENKVEGTSQQARVNSKHQWILV